MKKKKLTEKEIQKALGADRTIKLKSGKAGGPIDWLAQTQEVFRIKKDIK